MKRQSRFWWLVAFLVGISLPLALNGRGSQAEEPLPALLTGAVYDRQDQPVHDAAVTLLGQGKEPLAEAITQPDGRYALVLPETFPDNMEVQIERPHFAAASIVLSAETVEVLRNGASIVLPDVILLRCLTLAFWIATAVFAGVLVLIATGKLHNTLAALLGASMLLAVSYLGHILSRDLYTLIFRERCATATGM